MKEIPESDWKYLRTIKDKMLETLCKRLNDAALAHSHRHETKRA